MKSSVESTPGTAAAFFDLDKTIISVFSEQAFGMHLMKKGQLALYKILLIILSYVVYGFIIIRDYEKLKKMAVFIVMHGQRVERAHSLYKEFFERVLVAKIYKPIIEEIAKHKQQGRKLVLISSSVDLIVSRFSEYLGFDCFFAAQLEIKGKRYTGNVTGMVFNGKRKVEAVREFAEKEKIDLQRSYAYGDYVDDQYMLGLVGHPVAVNPDEKLRRIAQAGNWEIRNF